MSENSGQEGQLPVSGLHHVLLTVRDLARSTAFYTNVIGLRIWREIPEDGLAGAKTLFALPDGTMLGLVGHADGEDDVFDEKRAGLDHVALTVPTPDLSRWEQRLRDVGVPHSAPAPSAAGDPLIVVRDPDNIQLQIYGRGPS